MLASLGIVLGLGAQHRSDSSPRGHRHMGHQNRRYGEHPSIESIRPCAGTACASQRGSPRSHSLVRSGCYEGRLSRCRTLIGSILQVRMLTGECKMEVTTMTLSPDCSTVAAGYGDGSIRCMLCVTALRCRDCCSSEAYLLFSGLGVSIAEPIPSHLTGTRPPSRHYGGFYFRCSTLQHAD